MFTYKYREVFADRIHPFQDKKIATAFLINKRVKRSLIEPSLHEECTEKSTCSHEEVREHRYGREETCEFFKQWKCRERRCGSGYYCDTLNENGCRRLSQYQVFCQVRKIYSIKKGALKPGSKLTHKFTQTKSPMKKPEEIMGTAFDSVLSFSSLSDDGSFSWLSPAKTESDSKSSWLSRNLSVVIAAPIVVLVLTALLVLFLGTHYIKKTGGQYDDARNICKFQSSENNVVQRAANSMTDHVYDVVRPECENPIYQQNY